MKRPTTAKQRRNFTREFEAVARIAHQGKSLAEVARELGLSEGLRRSWKGGFASEGERAFFGMGKAPAVEEELRRVRDALVRAVARAGLVARSDRGSQNAAEHYQHAPAGRGITCSPTRRAGC